MEQHDDLDARLDAKIGAAVRRAAIAMLAAGLIPALVGVGSMFLMARDNAAAIQRLEAAMSEHTSAPAHSGAHEIDRRVVLLEAAAEANRADRAELLITLRALTSSVDEVEDRLTAIEARVGVVRAQRGR